MKISAKSRYGLRAMACLARERKVSPVGLVAEKETIPREYLEKIFARLKAAGLVKTVRGARGGYILARPAGKISAAEIVRALEGSLAPASCVAEGKDREKICSRRRCCCAKDVWRKVRDAVSLALGSITLKDLIE